MGNIGCDVVPRTGNRECAVGFDESTARAQFEGDIVRAVGCRRCRLRSRLPPEEAPPSYGRRAAPFFDCSPLVAAAPRLSATAPWVPAYHMPLSPLAPFVARPPFAQLIASLPGGYMCPRRWGGCVPSPLGAGGAVAPWSVGRRFAPPALGRVSLLGRLRRPASLPPKVARRAPRLNRSVRHRSSAVSWALALTRPRPREQQPLRRGK